MKPEGMFTPALQMSAAGPETGLPAEAGRGTERNLRRTTNNILNALIIHGIIQRYGYSQMSKRCLRENQL